jgi:hypothetical protein
MKQDLKDLALGLLFVFTTGIIYLTLTTFL